MTTAQREAIEKHGQQLLAIFPDATDRDPVSLCRKLRRIESKGERLAVDRCNRHVSEQEQERRTDAIMGALEKLLGFTTAGVPVFLNGDPRGYALKIEDEWMRAHDFRLHTDWGGYGIIAPEIGKDGDH